MFGFGLKRLRSDNARLAGPEADAALAPANAPPMPGEVVLVPARRTNPIYVARQPILDRESNVAGYELLFRNGPENRYSSEDPELATAQNIEQTVAAFGLDALVGDRTAFVNLSRGALLREFYRLLPPERTVIELLESVAPDREVIRACLGLKAAGYQLALDDFACLLSAAPLLELADVVKVDFRQTALSCDPRLIERLRMRKVCLIAEKVETQPEHRQALAAGYDLLQGYYYCHPEMVETGDLPPTKLSRLQFLSEVSRDDVSFERLENLFRQDVGLTMRLLRYLNSAAFGWRHGITSLRHALALMGLRPLRKWATMMGLVSLGQDRPRELIVTSLVRARFAEELGVPSGLPDHELELFLSGLFSVAEAIIGRPIADILDGLAVPDAVRAALTGGESPVSPVLRLVTAYERGDWALLESLRPQLEIEERVLSEAYVRALQWAEATANA